jgi:hypothetical protein
MRCGGRLGHLGGGPLVRAGRPRPESLAILWGGRLRPAPEQSSAEADFILRGHHGSAAGLVGDGALFSGESSRSLYGLASHGLTDSDFLSDDG